MNSNSLKYNIKYYILKINNQKTYINELNDILNNLKKDNIKLKEKLKNDNEKYKEMKKNKLNNFFQNTKIQKRPNSCYKIKVNRKYKPMIEPKKTDISEDILNAKRTLEKLINSYYDVKSQYNKAIISINTGINVIKNIK